ncbi:hypothetical protein T459_31257 [Capsicum annuum]|uniref:Ankyrin repeat domain-containing protein n=1 Tax=Capsicum annuum TaxID=4072 RepID=A0A2G2YAP9_CAPAN|nr:hypothetical protein T459_31257 [Capsicum annuum]
METLVNKFSKLAPEDRKQRPNDNRASSSEVSGEDIEDGKKSKDKSIKKKTTIGEPKTESEYKKGLRPVLWLTPDFPLKTEELMVLLDILANKVKAVRRLRELLTTKLPPDTFLVKLLDTLSLSPIHFVNLVPFFFLLFLCFLESFLRWSFSA